MTRPRDLLEPPVEGWWIDGHGLNTCVRFVRRIPAGSPPRRGQNTIVARRPGRRWRPKPIDQRTETLLIGIDDTDLDGEPRGPDQMRRNLDDLRRILYVNDRLMSVEQRFLLPNRRLTSRTTRAEFVDALEPDLASAARAARITVDLLLVNGVWFEPPRHRTVDGERTVWNPGTVRHFDMTLTFTGPLDRPTLTNDATGVACHVDRTLDSYDSVTVDVPAFTAVDQGGSDVVADVTRTGSDFFMELAPDRNPMRLEVEAGSVDGDVEIVWRAAFA